LLHKISFSVFSLTLAKIKGTIVEIEQKNYKEKIFPKNCFAEVF